MKKSLLAPKKLQSSSKEIKDKKSCSKWEESNSALATAVLFYQKKQKQDKKFKFPQLMINNLYSFNNLRLKYSLDGTASPSSTGSLSVSQSAINQRFNLTNATPKSSSGIYLS
jgi:hypothetical protein